MCISISSIPAEYKNKVVMCFVFVSASVVRSQLHFVIKSHGNGLWRSQHILPLIRWTLALVSEDREAA